MNFNFPRDPLRGNGDFFSNLNLYFMPRVTCKNCGAKREDKRMSRIGEDWVCMSSVTHHDEKMLHMRTRDGNNVFVHKCQIEYFQVKKRTIELEVYRYNQLLNSAAHLKALPIFENVELS